MKITNSNLKTGAFWLRFFQAKRRCSYESEKRASAHYSFADLQPCAFNVGDKKCAYGTDLEKETIEEIIEILSAEFEK